MEGRPGEGQIHVTSFAGDDVAGGALRDQARAVLELVARYPGIDRTGCSRFSRIAKAVVEEGPNLIRPERPDFRMVVQGLKDLQELVFAANVLGPEMEQPVVLRKLKSTFKDDPIPSGSGDQTDGRNHQFELFAHAILKRAGLRPEAQETGVDFRIQQGRFPLVVEAKRVKSLDRLEQRVAKAAKQIEESGLAGYIFVDLSCATGTNDNVVATAGDVDLARAQRLRMNRLMADYGAKMQKAIGDRFVLGVTFFDHVIQHAGVQADGRTGNWILNTVRDNIVWNTPAPRDQGLVKRFFFATNHALPTPVLSSAS